MNILISSMDSELFNLIDRIGEREFVGTVVNIFDKVINVETSLPSSLITIANTQVISAPFMLKISDENDFNHLKQSVDIGDTFYFDEKGQISVNNDRLIFCSSTRWQCLLPLTEVNGSKLVDMLKEVNSFLRNEGKSGGILNAYLSRATNDNEDLKFNSIYDNYFRQLLQQLSEQFDGDNLKKLIGLGVGLTPSGDDFIVGVLATLYSYDTSRQFINGIKSQISKESILGKTTRVSTHMLTFALDGYFNEALLNLFSEKKQIDRSLKQLKSIGSTSGTDMLSGVSFALEQLIKEFKRRDQFDYKSFD
ncbi:DUF2877 domain-containing protein [Alkalibacterium sp. f15]|uniref:DUF2877 domain-containing protein n=1 Tax=Alkalibacterium sp. f15 TaxID=3414029 RepID=UPI003BF916DB